MPVSLAGACSAAQPGAEQGDSFVLEPLHPDLALDATSIHRVPGAHSVWSDSNALCFWERLGAGFKLGFSSCSA